MYTTEDYNRDIDRTDHCKECGARVGLGGPMAEDTYGWARIHKNWHLSLNRSINEGEPE